MRYLRRIIHVFGMCASLSPNNNRTQVANDRVRPRHNIVHDLRGVSLLNDFHRLKRYADESYCCDIDGTAITATETMADHHRPRPPQRVIDYAAADAGTGHHHHQHRAYSRGGDGDHWFNSTRPPRRPYKKCTVFRKYDAGGGGNRAPEVGPNDKCTKTPSSISSSSVSSASSSSSSSASSSPSPSPKPRPRYLQEPFHRRINNGPIETCETIEWKVMSKHFAR